MVVFICNGCGDSLKRSEVDTHTYRCQNCTSVSCADCNNDFFGKDYKAHQTCISEVEKYSAKDFKPKVAKGVVKQDSWLKIVTEAIASPQLPGNLNAVAQGLKGKGNVPRSKPRFLNFMKNCLKSHGDASTFEQLWEFLNTFATTQNKTVTPQSQQNAKKAAKSQMDDASAKRDVDCSKQTENTDDSRHRKKWIKRVRRTIEQYGDQCSSNIDTFVNQLKTCDDIPCDEKLFAKYMEERFGLRKSKTARELWLFITQTEAEEVAVEMDTAENGDVEKEKGNNDDDEGDEQKNLSKRDRKKLRHDAQTKKQKKDRVENKNVDENVKASRKRRRDKGLEADDDTLGENCKKSRDDSGIAMTGNESQDEDGKMEAATDTPQPTSIRKLHPKKFGWSKVLMEKVRASKNQQMKVSRLKKIAIAECVKECGDVTPHESLDKLFTNAIRRCSDLKIEKDRIVLNETQDGC